MYELIIIGAGPAGISMGVEAHNLGIASDKSLILEKAAEHSFTIKKFYTDKKRVTANYKGFTPVCEGVMCLEDSSKHETISYLDKAIEDHKLNVHYNETVSEIIKSEKDNSFRVGTDKNTYHARIVVIAVGILGKPNKPDYKVPVEIKDKILFDITTTEIRNSKILIVGGGDSASEYCQFLSHPDENNQVYLSYRRNEFGRMNMINSESLKSLVQLKRVKLLMNTNIESLSAKGLKPQVHFTEDSVTNTEFDYIIYALGGTTPVNFLKMIGVGFNGPEPMIRKGYETNIPGLFLIGDLSAGKKGGSIIGAFNSANTAMQMICKNYLKCNARKSGIKFAQLKG